MPSEEYTSVSRGALKLKGAKVHKKSKNKHKSSKDKADQLKSAMRRTEGGGSDTSLSRTKSQENSVLHPEEGDNDGDQQSQLDSTQRQLQKRRSRSVSFGGDQEVAAEEDTKTEAERRFAEIKRKRLKELAESARVRPELLKTHKQRVEELNSHLSRLSEHHDMPKIGPG
ncbi:hypothetical protein B0H66DRAFT_600006 [Apodospora peruviana]|uniref:DUF1754-domain-containing protein n=1 Tax=Apodospora peruviana TaxID=516989 RepID=A0AAE0IJ16_9PEZI|nr:hypothetical protein B0H66DRAFT_600006 [Apodospora peruviana]